MYMYLDVRLPRFAPQAAGSQAQPFAPRVLSGAATPDQVLYEKEIKSNFLVMKFTT